MTAAPPAKSVRKPVPRKVPTSTVTRERPPTASRVRKERDIVQHAEIQFAQFGFQGASLENIAVAAGISRHNLLYYFPSKEALYQRVLDDVLDTWLAGMQDLSKSTDPETALRQYIRAKLRYSREHPHGAKVFTKEVIAGLPRYRTAIAQRVGPVLAAEVRTFERWSREGKIAPLHFTHLLFAIWSVTQAYADQEAQFALLLGKPALTAKDYEKAEEVIVHMIWSALAP